MVQGTVTGDAAVAHGLADAHQLLADNPAGANREVAHLGIAHLLVGQAHIGATGLDQGVGIGMPQGIHHRGFGVADGVVLLGRAIAPAIQDGQHHWRHGPFAGHRFDWSSSTGLGELIRNRGFRHAVPKARVAIGGRSCFHPDLPFPSTISTSSKLTALGPRSPVQPWAG